MSITRKLQAVAGALLLTASLAGGAHAQAPAKPLTEAQVQEIVKAWIEKNPEVVLQAINGYVLAQRQKEAGEQNAATARFEAELSASRGAAVVGNPQGKVTLVYVVDAACGFCKQMTPILGELVKENKDLRIVHRWVNFLSPESEYAERMALTVYKRHQGVYYDFYVNLMGIRSRLSNDLINEVAIKLLGKEAALQVIAEVAAGPARPEMDETVAQNLAMAQRAGVSGTPTFIFAGLGTEGIVRGAKPIDDLRRLVEKARALPAR